MYFCFQCQCGDYYNLVVADLYNKQHQFSSRNLNEIESKLKVIWGHVLINKPMPVPTGFPQPRSVL